jgi:hypothetical protein
MDTIAANTRWNTTHTVACEVCNVDTTSPNVWGCSARGYTRLCDDCVTLWKAVVDTSPYIVHTASRDDVITTVRAIRVAITSTHGEWIVCVRCSHEGRVDTMTRCTVCDMFVHVTCNDAHMQMHIDAHDACMYCHADIRETACLVMCDSATIAMCAQCVCQRSMDTNVGSFMWNGMITCLRDLACTTSYADVIGVLRREHERAQDDVRTCAAMFAQIPNALNYRELYDVMGAMQFVDNAIKYVATMRDA